MPAWSEAYEAYVQPILAQEDVPGLAVAIAESGRPIYVRGFGHRDRAAGLPVSEHTLFGIGSITKSITAIAIMQLQESGRLHVDDPLARHLPELRLPNMGGPNPIRLAHLLAHSSGMPPTPLLHAALTPSLLADPDVPPAIRAELPPAVHTWEDLTALLNGLDIRSLAEPGRIFSYWNDGWALLGRVIECASETRYETYVHDHILAPAGMTESTFDIRGREDGPDTARLYNHRRGADGGDESYDAGPWWDAPVMTAAGFLRSTTHDMLRYMEIYRTEGLVGDARILAPESVREMVKPRIWCDATMSYGYGLMITDNYHGVRIVGHGGGIKGVSAWVGAVPERGLTAVGLSSLSGGPTWRAVHAATSAALGLDPATPRLAFPPYAADVALDEYTGVYDSGESYRGDDQSIRISLADGAVTFETMGERRALRPVDPDGFLMTAHGDDQYIRFLRDETGRVFAVHSGFRAVRRVG
jgi:CubicO group peptidase (beta-lactamase class C family)